MTTKTLRIHPAPIARLGPSLRPLRTMVLIIAFLAGMAAITVAATASAMMEESGSMAGYA